MKQTNREKSIELFILIGGIGLFMFLLISGFSKKSLLLAGGIAVGCVLFAILSKLVQKRSETLKAILRGLAVTLLAIMVSGGFWNVLADDGLTLGIDNLTVETDNKEVWRVESGELVGSAEASTNGCNNTTKTEAYVKFTNSSNTEMILFFDYSVPDSGSLTFSDNTTATEDASKSVSIPAGESFQVTLTSDDTTTPCEAKLYNFSFQQKQNIAVTFVPVAGVTYTVDGQTISSVTTFEKQLGASYSIAATTGKYYLVNASWVSADSGGVFTIGSGTITPTSACTITPNFIFDENGVKPFLVGSTSYWTWEDAMSAAGNSGTVILTDNYTFPTTYSANILSGAGEYVTGTDQSLIYKLPQGVTLLLPYASGQHAIKSGTSTKNDFKHANVAFAPDGDSTETNTIANEAGMNPERELYLTLTLPSGVTLDVENGTSSEYSRVVIGGTIAGNEGTMSTCFEGITYGAHSNLIVDGTLNLGSYSILSAVGYVLGDGQIVTTGSNATLYQPLGIHDWRGARNSIPFIKDQNQQIGTIQSGESEISPFTTWGTFNIQPSTKITYGNYMYLYASLYDGDAYCTHPCFVGTSASTEALFKLSEGGVFESVYKDIVWGDKYTYGFPGKMHLSFSGGMTVGSLKLVATVAVSIFTKSVNIDTSKYTFPFSYNYSFDFDDGDYYIDNSMSLLPGVSMTVSEGAVLHVGTKSTVRFMVFDGLNNRFYHNNNIIAYVENTRNQRKNYPTTGELQAATVDGYAMSADAELIVNGKLVIGSNASFGGMIQTQGSGIVDASAGTAGSIPSATVQIGIHGKRTVSVITSSDAMYSGMTLHQSNARLVLDETGEVINIVRGNIYGGKIHQIKQENYSFKYYSNYDNINEVILVGDATALDTETVTATYRAHPLNETIYGSWYIVTLPVHSASDRKDYVKIDAEYRLQDYLWLNAICYLDKTYKSVDPEDITLNGLEDADIVVATGEDSYPVLYIVKKIPSDEIADTLTFTIKYNDLISAPITISVADCKYTQEQINAMSEADKSKLKPNETNDLVDALITYGKAAKKYFVTGGTPESLLDMPNMTDYTVFSKTPVFPASNTYNNVSLVTKGANVLFEERLSMMFGFQFSGTMTEDDVVQVGVLIGSVNGGELTATSENVTRAYILYGKSNDSNSDNKPNLPSYDGFEVDAKETVSWDKLNASGRMVLYMDLKSEDYTSAFEFRPFAITKDGTVLYGAQYAYSLADYINNMLTMSNDDLKEIIGPKDVNAFRNLLAATWDYALEAKARFGKE